MTVPCTSCGEILDPADDRCPYCGTLAPPPPGTSVFAHEAVGPRWADEPTRVGDPLAIPIREPSVPTSPDPDGGGIPRPVLVALAAVAVMALVAVLAAQALGGGDGGEDLASGGGSEPAGDEEVATDERSTTTTTAATTSTASTTSSTTTTSTTTTTTTTAPAPTTTAAPATTAAPGSVPTLPPSFRGGWVAQLSSVPAAAGAQAIEAAYDRIRSDVPGARAARSDEWPSMSPGYWVFVETGFGSEDAVRSFCSSVGRSGDACLPRQLADRR